MTPRLQNIERRKTLPRRSHEGLRLDGVIKSQTEAELANDNHGFLPAGYYAEDVVSTARNRMTAKARKDRLHRVFALIAVALLASFFSVLIGGLILYFNWDLTR